MVVLRRSSDYKSLGYQIIQCCFCRRLDTHNHNCLDAGKRVSRAPTGDGTYAPELVLVRARQGCAGHPPRSCRGIAALHLYHTLSGQQTLSVRLRCAHNICSLRFLRALTKTGVGRYSALQGLVSLDFVHPRYNVPSQGTPLANAT